VPALAASLIGAVRVHLYGVRDAPCGGPPESPEAREVAQRLVKQTQELADHADVLMRELESRSVRFAKPPYGSRRGPGTSRVCPNDPRRSARRTAVRNRSCRVCQKPPRRPPAASPMALRVGDRLDDETGASADRTRLRAGRPPTFASSESSPTSR